MQCPRCEGTGECSECHGQGSVTCVSCDGSGQRTSSRGATYPCRNCQGTGAAACAPKCASCEGSGQITDALQRKVRDKYETRFDQTLPRTAVTFALIFACIFLYCLGVFNPKADNWLDANWSNISSLWSTQPWRLLSYALIHGGFIHMACNMSTLIRYGPILEGHYGSRRYALSMMLCILGGGLVSALGHQAMSQNVVSLGMSGGIFGLFGMLFGAYQRYRIFNGQQLREQLTWLAVFASVTLAWGGNIDNWCHLGGFLAGFAYAWFTRRPSGR
ncbi:MAG: rhomboid family intramembrane serine protease [Candidatus Eremiobacteraeota bacterium]|nr:rhomboid family intramembrane serine protease [Candidatus Eremiobacteraeota bacterium]